MVSSLKMEDFLIRTDDVEHKYRLFPVRERMQQTKVDGHSLRTPGSRPGKEDSNNTIKFNH